MAGLDERRVRIYEIIFNNFCKLGLIVVVVYVFLKTFNRLLDASTAFDAAKFGAIELILAGTLYKVYWHYFPSKTAEAITATSEERVNA